VKRIVDLSMPVHMDMVTFPRVPPPALTVYESHEQFAQRIGAAEQITDEELERLAALIEEMRAGAAAGDRVAESAADSAFHATIVEVARNGVLSRQWEQLQPHARTFISLTLPSSDGGPVADRHLPILDALERRDPDAAVQAMQDHLSEVAARLAPLAQADPHKETP
jgi:DNA-binding GntR family transcriptional regulator